MFTKAGTMPISTVSSQCLAQRMKGRNLTTDKQISFYLA